jgi:hypothetical protein
MKANAVAIQLAVTARHPPFLGLLIMLVAQPASQPEKQIPLNTAHNDHRCDAYSDRYTEISVSVERVVAKSGDGLAKIG